jgi:peroxiredoxin
MKKSLILIFTLLTFHLSAQYKIEVKIQTYKDTLYMIAYPMPDGKTMYPQDTVKADGHSNLVFEGTKKLLPGMYYLIKGRTKLLDFALVDNHLQIEADTTNLVESIRIKGSAEAQDFADYGRQSMILNRAYGKAKDNNERSHIYDTYTTLVKNYIARYPRSFTGNFLKAVTPVEMPALAAISTRQDTLNYLKHYYTHALDNLALDDDRLMRTPVLDGIVDAYLSNIDIHNAPDTIIALADNIIARTKINSDLRRYMVIKFGNKFLQTGVLGCDRVYVELAEKYILKEPALYNDVTIQKNKEYINRIKPMMVGNIMPDMCLTDTSGKANNLWDMPSKYTMVVIYDYSCGHCQEFTKKLVDYYPKLEQKGMQVYMCCRNRDRSQWLKFIKEYKTTQFTNVMDARNVVDFDNQYNASLVPKVYLLDKDKMILNNLRLELSDFEKMMSTK